MRVFFIMFCLVILNSSSLQACDAYGCAAGYSGIGLMSKYRGNYIRISYVDFRYHANPEHANSNSQDLFSQVGLSFRYAFAKAPKLRFNAYAPYGFNSRNQLSETQSMQGFADAKIIVNYAILNNKAIGDKQTIFLEVGGGLNLPTGKYNHEIGYANLPDNFNIGLGSYGYILQLNSIWSKGKSGFLLNGNYQLNGKTQEGYHFGNQLTGEISWFREWNVKKQLILPNLGLVAGHVSVNRYNNGNKVPETGGNGLLVSAGINIKSKDLISGITYSIPVIQNYSK